jgi:hypothetical protein
MNTHPWGTRSWCENKLLAFLQTERPDYRTIHLRGLSILFHHHTESAAIVSHRPSSSTRSDAGRAVVDDAAEAHSPCGIPQKRRTIPETRLKAAP